MATQLLGKPGADQVPLDYFKHPDFFQRWKLRLAGIALIATLAWLAVGSVSSDGGRLRYSRGPVAAVHATWDDQCAACHVDFTPIRRDSGASRFWAGFHASDKLCADCHAGPPHSQFQIAAEVPACAGCHREHRGREASLVRLPDRTCVDCHGDLQAHVQPPHQTRIGNVTRFDADGHPEFHALRDRIADPGRLHFSHKVHLTPGMGGGKPREGSQVPFTLARIADETDRQRYRSPGQEKANDARNVVRLDCASCHQLDPGDFPGSAGGSPSVRGLGDYMVPITYENQCRACHPLTLTAPAKKGRLAPLTVLHRLQPDVVHDFLEGALVARYLEGNPHILAAKFTPPRAIPGRAPGKEEETAKAFIQRQLAVAETRLYVGNQTCGECHEFTTASGRATFDKIRPGNVPGFKVKPTAVPSIWFAQARFRHSAHRALSCVDCHMGADSSDSSRDVLLPGIKTCLQCHAPAGHEGKAPRGGARFDCTECHRYHHGDVPLQGRGASARGAKGRLTIDQFLSGGAKLSDASEKH